MKKNVTGYFARNVLCGAVKCVLVQKKKKQNLW